MDLISVIVPVYNAEKYISACLESLSNQTYTNLEIILVDDGSTDSSGKICDEYASKDNRFKVFHKANGGVSSARNLGLSHATGDYYHFPDCDDYLDIDTYEYLMNLIKEKHCDAVAFEHFTTYTDKEIEHCLPDYVYGYKNNQETQAKLFTGSQFCCNKLYAKKLIEGLTFREDIHRGEDTLFAAHALSRADKVWFDKRPMYHYVQSEESACRGAFRPSQFTVLKLYDAYEELYKVNYPNVFITFLLFMQDVLISLYYDAWIDAKSSEYATQLQEIVFYVRKYYKVIKKSGFASKKQLLKAMIFKISPKLFCQIHKLIHRL